MNNIVYNKEEFLRDILIDFNNYRVEENKIRDYLNLAIKAIRLTEKNFTLLEKEMLKEEGLKIKKIKVLLDNETVILKFTNNSKVLFSKESILKKYSLFNDTINYLNEKITKRNKLQLRKIVDCGKYGFLEASEFINEKRLFKYYFKSGELLAVLYLLCCKDTENLFSLSMSITDDNLHASNVARHILKVSVRTIDFLPLDKMNLASSNVECIKSGFKYMYNIIISNKAEFIYFINHIFDNNINYLGNILTRINMLNEEDLKIQLYLIENRFSKIQCCRKNIALSEDESPKRVDKERFIELADSLGNHLIQRSIIGYNNGNISRIWINSVLPEFSIKSEVQDNIANLYEYNNGIALFFAYLGEVTKKKYFVNVSLEIMQESIEGMDNMGEYSKVIVYDLFTLSKIYSITKSKVVESSINKGIQSIYKIIEEDTKDCVSASDAAIILSIYDTIECNKTQKLILDLANLLYKNIKFDKKCEEVLVFLIKLMSITGDKNIEKTIDRLLDFERKESLNKNYFEILLNRLRLKELEYNDNLINEEINEALNYIIKNGFEKSNSYYYNREIGNIEILEYAAEVLGNEILKNRCINTYNNIVNQIIKPAICKEIIHGNNSISLINGIVGYGYSLIEKCTDRKILPILFNKV